MSYSLSTLYPIWRQNCIDAIFHIIQDQDTFFTAQGWKLQTEEEKEERIEEYFARVIYYTQMMEKFPCIT